MSKGKVWNRGKHNGRGLPPRKEYKGPDNSIGNNAGNSEVKPSGLIEDSIPSRINSVQLMNREHWIGRVNPVKRERLDSKTRK
jgi:hypothetical protein